MNDNATSCSLEHMVTIATAHQSLEQMVDKPWAIWIPFDYPEGTTPKHPQKDVPKSLGKARHDRTNNMNGE